MTCNKARPTRRTTKHPHAGAKVPIPTKARLTPGRPSKLTQKQWAEIGRRLALGETTSALAREFGVGKARISERFSGKTQELKTIASQVVKLDDTLDKLPDSERSTVLSLADAMKATSNNLAAAARAGSATSAHLAGIAHGKAVQLDPEAVDMNDLREISALTQTANQAATIGTALIAFPKNSRLDEAPPKPKSAYDLSLLSNEALRVIQHLYKKAEGGPVKALDRYSAENLIRAFEKCMAEIKEVALQPPGGSEP